MTLPTPRSYKDYPWYIFMYWILTCAILFSLAFVVNSKKISPDGMYIVDRHCIESVRGTRDEPGECLKYGEPIYTPIGIRLKELFKNIAVGTGVIFLLGGLYVMYMERKEGLK